MLPRPGSTYAPRMRRRLVAVAVVPLLLLGACGGSDSGSAPTATEPGPAESASGAQGEALEQAVVRDVDAFHGGRADDAYAFLSARCRQELPFTEFRRMTSQATALDGDDPLRDVEATADGARGTVSYELDVESLSERDQPWVREDGGWRNDDC
ncbi:major membrane immunogen (membrane-anchored lipoprotein) [Aeromicrobium sp. SORGH_AS981]|nr:major membrane immunogen (membrane-anchored lipoprotein) [Aeromicrobium sp. SORGH_AS_0981]